MLGVVEPHSGLQFEIPPQVHCVYVPRGQLAEDCDAPDDAALARAEAGGIFLLARDNNEGVLTGFRSPMPDAKSLSDVALDEFIRGIAQGMQEQTGATVTPRARGAHLFTLQHGDLLSPPVAQFDLVATPESLEKRPNLAFSTGALVPTKSDLLTFQRQSVERDDVVGALTRSIKTPANDESASTFGRDRNFKMGHALGQLVGALFCPLVILLFVISLVRKGKKAATPPPPKP